jgi:glucosyl-dolichyl phosphate glucuronosyltransferase
MEISVILSTYKRAELLARTLNSFCFLTNKAFDWEVIVVDNANDPETQYKISEFSAKLPVKCIVETKKGKNNALNTAVETAKGDLLVFTDDDIIADCNWLTQMWEGSKRWPDFSIFGGKILPDFPPGSVPISAEHPFYSCAYVVADWKNEEGQYPARYVWGPNMAIRSRIFHEGARFDSNIGPCGNNYIMGSETELTGRLEKMGNGAIFLPLSLVFHQIRPEQLEITWLYGRAFRYGRSLAQTSGSRTVPFIFKAPRFLFRELLTAAIKKTAFFFYRKKKHYYGIEYWIIRGEIYQFRIASEPPNSD